MSQFSLLPVVSATKSGKVVASSVDVAAYFGKQHAHVLRALRSLFEDAGIDFDAHFSSGDQSKNGAISADKKARMLASYFQQGSYLDAMNRLQPCYYMTEMGFSILANRFTGAKALDFQLAYHQAFHMMAARLAASSHLKHLEQMDDVERESRADALVKVNGQRAALAAQAMQLKAEGLTYEQIAQLLHLSSRYAVYRLIRRYGPGLASTSIHARMLESYAQIQKEEQR